MKTKPFLIILFWSSFALAQKPNNVPDKNTISVLFIPKTHLGFNYHRNINAYFGITATTRVQSYAASYDYRSQRLDPFEFPEGQYIYLNEYLFRPSIATTQPDFIHPNANPFGARIMGTNILGGIGFFGEKRELFFKRMNFKASAYAQIFRVTYIEEQSGNGGFNLPVGPNGEEPFKFMYFHNHYEQYWTKPFVSFDFQLDWRIYKSLHLGMYIHYTPITYRAHFFWPLASFVIATTF
jgi:hypothetical protein